MLCYVDWCDQFNSPIVDEYLHFIIMTLDSSELG